MSGSLTLQEQPEASRTPGGATALDRLTTGLGLGLVGGLALVLLVAALWSWTRPDPIAAEDAGRVAQQVAERAVVPIVSYDYRTLDEDESTATSYLTTRYRKAKFAPLWAAVKKNAPASRTVITATVVGSGVVRATQDRVQVLVLVDRPTSNADSPTPVVYQDHVLLTLVKAGGDWLIDDLSTQ